MRTSQTTFYTMAALFAQFRSSVLSMPV